MRRLLLALPFALLPLSLVYAHDDHDHEHGSLGAHEHGVAHLNVALDGNALELEFDSPAMNLVGFEHAATSTTDKAKVAAVRAQLETPLALFALNKAAGCSETDQDLQSPLFGDKPVHDEDGDAHDHEHSDINVHYKLECTTPAQLTRLDLAPLFKAFPATQKIQLQLVGPNGQKGVDLTPTHSAIDF